MAKPAWRRAARGVHAYLLCQISIVLCVGILPQSLAQQSWRTTRSIMSCVARISRHSVTCVALPHSVLARRYRRCANQLRLFKTTEGAQRVLDTVLTITEIQPVFSLVVFICISSSRDNTADRISPQNCILAAAVLGEVSNRNKSLGRQDCTSAPLRVFPVTTSSSSSGRFRWHAIAPRPPSIRPMIGGG